ncbi:unnamed protein product [Haemonchus placei]|uniref:Nucleotid_trans domain-containing protein n=1 Tax=Haemonchus placei TaxID=6290 RepID=A0A0N4WK79_HAEPC|nr:unnamed protein product [Haemonchus placei]
MIRFVRRPLPVLVILSLINPNILKLLLSTVLSSSRTVCRVMEMVSSSMKESHIAIVQVVEENIYRPAYGHAIMSVACYAKAQRYDHFILVDQMFFAKCLHKNRFFLQHCIVAYVLRNYDYVLFLDTNIGVVNPKRRIEEYVDENVDLIFAERAENWEFVTETYLVKNSKRALNFLNGLADYESRVPKRLRGKHSAIIHATAWTRESWTTNSKWSKDRDFMLSYGNESDMIPYLSVPVPLMSTKKATWYNPLEGSIDIMQCKSGGNNRVGKNTPSPTISKLGSGHYFLTRGYVFGLLVRACVEETSELKMLIPCCVLQNFGRWFSGSICWAILENGLRIDHLQLPYLYLLLLETLMQYCKGSKHPKYF